MRTPAGKECRYFYGDYHRGRHTEVCRLLERRDGEWRPSLCRSCPVPDILLANACPNLTFYGRVTRKFGLWKRVEVVGVCRETGKPLDAPEVGCGHCHEFDGKERE